MLLLNFTHQVGATNHSQGAIISILAFSL